jgi:uncharacterized protein YjbI with pentapeptide repeats
VLGNPTHDKALLKGANLSGVDLSTRVLSGYDLSGANLTGAKLTDANLDKANVKGVRFPFSLTMSEPHGPAAAQNTAASLQDGNTKTGCTTGSGGWILVDLGTSVPLAAISYAGFCGNPHYF